MIKDGFMYIAALLFIASVLVFLPRIFKGPTAQKVFKFAPPIVLIYLGLMFFCTIKLWDLDATGDAYNALKNPILYAMLFVMLLRCDLKKILRLGPKMLIGFFSATLSIGLGFVVSYAIMHGVLGADAWKALGALCGSWMGGGGNMLAIQAALDVPESSMAYALVMDSICATLYVMFLLWAINFSEKFNKWTKADTKLIDSVGAALEEEAKANTQPLVWHNIMILMGSGLLVSAVSQALGTQINKVLPFLDKATWTVLVVTALGLIFALTPFGKLRGTEEVSNVMLYSVVALIASRADLSAMGNAPAWLFAGLIILVIHVAIMIVLAKLLKIDIFTAAVASLANIGGTATAPVLAGTYSSALVPVGIIMALLGYVVGTGGGLIVAQLMSLFG
ncbi:MAG: DUF819 domain-containing protein [Oscillospiraceae bacterium]|nr:DUF819 domain-containing protein [Oscillospiraceae bacterium]